ncbi:MAG TPA: sensor histidine kinase KdpD [Hydrogenobaculum sp.]|nr:sensor histidine kinase KdpD [Hydrogenobaculum sp.]
MEEERPIPESLLEIAEEKKNRGKLTIYLGAMPGVGKTYAMLSDARIKKQDGVDIKIGFVETHGRKETEKLLEGLDIIPPLEVEYNGIKLKELNLDEILKIKPQICIIDELPHSNPPNFRNKKRYQDVEEVLNAGIDVWTAMNVQHIESISDIVYQITGVKVRETVPDEFVKNADEIKLIDLPPEELIQRLKDGKVYVPDLAQEAIKKYFRPGNIMALRELSMRIAADKLNKKLNTYMKEHAIAGPWAIKERIVVGIYASPFAEHLVRAAYRVATEIDADWIAIYVETEKHTYLTDKELDWLQKALELAKSLGAEIVWIKDEDVPNAIIRYIKSHNINKIIIGKPKKFPIFRGSIFRKIAQNTKYVDIYILDPPIAEAELFIPSKKRISLPKLYLPKLYNVFIGLFLVFLATFIGLQFRSFLNQLNLVFLFLLALSLAAVMLDTYSTIFATLVSIIIFDYFFIPPYYSFAISDINYFLSYTVFAVMIVFINLLSVRLKRNLKQLQKSEEKSNVLFELSRKLLRINSKEECISITVRYVKIFVEDVAIFLKDKENIHIQAVTKNMNINERVKTIVQWCIKNKKPAGFSTQTFSEDPYFYMPLIYKDDIYGVMIFDMSKSKETDYELISILEAIADLFTASIVKYV